MSYIALQRICDDANNMFGYEALYRDSKENQYPTGVDGDFATRDVISKAPNIEIFTSDAKIFLNLTEETLLSEEWKKLDPDRFVLEILETINITNKNIEAIIHAKELGYAIAIDDYNFEPERKRLIEHADIIKIDVKGTPLSYMGENIKNMHRRPSQLLLAEKVDDHSSFLRLQDLGFDLFQGYFIAKPVVHELLVERSN